MTAEQAIGVLARQQALIQHHQHLRAQAEHQLENGLHQRAVESLEEARIALAAAIALTHTNH